MNLPEKPTLVLIKDAPRHSLQQGTNGSCNAWSSLFKYRTGDIALWNPYFSSYHWQEHYGPVRVIRSTYEPIRERNHDLVTLLFFRGNLSSDNPLGQSDKHFLGLFHPREFTKLQGETHSALLAEIETHYRSVIPKKLRPSRETLDLELRQQLEGIWRYDRLKLRATTLELSWTRRPNDYLRELHEFQNMKMKVAGSR